MIHLGEQGTEEWDAIRRGKVSASHMADVLMKPTTAGYRNYRVKLALERITGTNEATFSNYDMQRGIELEPDARISYSFVSGNDVKECMWSDHPTVAMAGCSPDGLIYDGDVVVGLTEFKCPKQATHLDYILTGKIDRNYDLQMQDQMLCTGAKWCDFVSYHPDFPDELQLKIIRVERDPVKIAELDAAIEEFDIEVTRVVEELDALSK